MAKRVDGKVTLEHEGKKYTLSIDFNALADFEEAAGLDNALDVIESGNLNVRHSRLLFWAALRQHHPDLSKEDAGRILTGNFDKLDEAFTAAFPTAANGEAGNGKAAPKSR